MEAFLVEAPCGSPIDFLRHELESASVKGRPTGISSMFPGATLIHTARVLDFLYTYVLEILSVPVPLLSNIMSLNHEFVTFHRCSGL